MSRHISAVPTRAIDDPRISDAHRVMLMVLGSITNRDGWASPELDRLGERLKIQRAAVSKRLSALEAAGYVQTHYEIRRGRRRLVIRVLFDAPIATATTAIDEQEAEEEARVSPEETQGPAALAVEDPPRVSPEETQGTPPVSGVETQASHEFPAGERRVSARETHIPIAGTATTTNPASPPPAPLDDRFEHQAHREAYRSIRRGHRLPAAFDAALEHEIHEPITGGSGFPWAVIGAALLQLQANGETFNVARLRGYCRLQLAGPPAPVARQLVRGGEPLVTVGGQEFTASAVWQLCVDGGLTSRGQSRNAISDRVAVLGLSGKVRDVVRFTDLVLLVQPWAIAEVFLAREREQRLRQALAMWRDDAPPQAAAS